MRIAVFSRVSAGACHDFLDFIGDLTVLEHIRSTQNKDLQSSRATAYFSLFYTLRVLFGITDPELDFSSGKPKLLTSDSPESKKLCFNISHSSDATLLFVSDEDEEVGADIEKQMDKARAHRVSERYLSEEKEFFLSEIGGSGKLSTKTDRKNEKFSDLSVCESKVKKIFCRYFNISGDTLTDSFCNPKAYKAENADPDFKVKEIEKADTVSCKAAENNKTDRNRICNTKAVEKGDVITLCKVEELEKACADQGGEKTPEKAEISCYLLKNLDMGTVFCKKTPDFEDFKLRKITPIKALKAFDERTKNGGEIEIYDLAAEDVSNDAAFATLLWCGLESRLKCSGGGFSDIHTEYKADKSYFGKMMLDQKTFYFSLSVKNAE